MKGQVFTVAKLHYVNGVVYEVAKQETTDLQSLANLFVQTTKSGKAKHPMVRVRTLARLAEDAALRHQSHGGLEKLVFRITSFANHRSLPHASKRTFTR